MSSRNSSEKKNENPFEQGLRLYAESDENQDPALLEAAAAKFTETEALARFFRGLAKMRLDTESLTEGLRDLFFGSRELLKDSEMFNLLQAHRVIRTLHQSLEGAAQHGSFVIDESTFLPEEKTDTLKMIRSLLDEINAAQHLEPAVLQKLHLALGSYLRRFSSVELGGKIV